jgi:hypothetical protein
MTPEPIPSSTGRMTAVMRGAPEPGAPRVLRAALVRGGRVVDERLLERGADLTVGPTERNAFVIADLPSSSPILAWSGRGWVLHVIAGMSGRVAMASGIIDLAEHRRARRGGGVLELSDEARGQVALGESMVLFHFVAPPPRRIAPRLPPGTRASPLGDLDWKTTLIAAFSFLLHFGAVGLLYSDWGDGVVDDGARVATLVEAVKDLPAPPPPEIREDRASSAGTVTKGVESAAPQPGPARAEGRRGGPLKTGGDRGSMGDARAHDLAKALSESDGSMMLALGARGAGGATQRVLEGGDAPAGLLDGIGAGAGGVRNGGVAGLDLGGGATGVVRPGAGGRRGLDAGNLAAGAPEGAGRATEVKKPVGGSASVDPPITSGGAIPNAAQVVASMRPGLRACYKKFGLDVDPTMQGSVRVTASVGSNGEVRSAQGGSVTGLSSAVVGCVVGRVRSAQFDPPVGGGATLVIPISFRTQQ